MKKIISLVMFAILITTCMFALAACGDDPNNDPILGWYVNKSNKCFLHFYCSEDKLYVEEYVFDVVSDTKFDDRGYKITPKGEVTKEKKVYTLLIQNSKQNYTHTYTVDTVDGLKVITTNFSIGGDKWRYITSAEKTLAEMYEINKTNHPWSNN